MKKPAIYIVTIVAIIATHGGSLKNSTNRLKSDKPKINCKNWAVMNFITLIGEWVAFDSKVYLI